MSLTIKCPFCGIIIPTYLQLVIPESMKTRIFRPITCRKCSLPATSWNMKKNHAVLSCDNKHRWYLKPNPCMHIAGTECDLYKDILGSMADFECKFGLYYCWKPRKKKENPK